MNAIRTLAVLAILTTFAATSSAQPMLVVDSVGTTPEGNLSWVAQVIPGSTGSIATQIMFSVEGGEFLAVSKNSTDWDKDNPIADSGGSGVRIGPPPLSLTAPLAITSSELFADFNRDGFVLEADYTIWRDMEGMVVTVPGEGADADGDGNIDDLDYLIWEFEYGSTSALTAPLTAADLVGSDSLYVALGSVPFTSTEPVDLVYFETSGLGPTIVSWDTAILAQGGMFDNRMTDGITGSETAQVPEPSAIAVAVVLCGLALAQRR